VGPAFADPAKTLWWTATPPKISSSVSTESALCGNIEGTGPWNLKLGGPAKTLEAAPGSTRIAISAPGRKHWSLSDPNSSADLDRRQVLREVGRS